MAHQTEVTRQGPITGEPAAVPKPRILLIDDQPARLLTYESILHGVGVECVRSLSGKDALARLLKERFALILLEVSMPETDGFETARMIRERTSSEQTPIIFVTGAHISILDTLKGYEAGAIDYISVPIVPEILRSKVALLVELYLRRAELERLNRELAAARERLQTERDHAVAAAQARREKEWLAAVLDSITDEVYFTDREGRYLYANSAAMHEFALDSIQGLEVAQVATKLGVLRPDGSPRPVEEAPALRALRGKIIRNEEQIVRSPRRGELRHRQVSSAPVRDAHGTIIGAVSVVRDITENRMQEQRLRQAEREHSELLNICSDAIFVWEFDGAIQYWNKGAEELYGFSNAEAVGKVSHDLLSTLHAEGMSHVKGELRQKGSWCGELTHRTKSGAVLTVQSSMQVVRRNSQVLVMESNRDLTERKRNEDLLQEADRRKNEFLAMLSHELRNPLAPIRNVAAYLNLPNMEGKRLEWARQVLQRQVSHMSRILDDLLDVTRITRGQLVLKKQSICLHEVIEVAIDAARPLIDAKAHQLLVDLPSGVITLNADPVRLAQVISNLLLNAAKYTDRDGLIRLTGRAEESILCLCVKDNGIGISPESIPQLFTMFSQLESTRERSEGGLGIGLALVKTIVELHGGTVTAKSAGQGAGSEFQICIPIGE